MTLKDKVVTITGAGGGIGAAAVSLFVERGAKVIACDIDAASVEELADRFKNESVIPVVADVSVEASNERIMKTAIDRCGRLDVAFLNAGIVGDMAPTHEYQTETFERVMRVNATSVFFGLKYSLKAMVTSGGGSIICMSSIQGLQACGYTVAYTASKHAVMGMVRNAALEYARHGIRVNAVNPGVTDTDLMRQVHNAAAPGDPSAVATMFANAVPMGRYGTPDEIARLVAFLASDDSSYITGQAHTIAGGMGVYWVPPMQFPAN